MKRERSILLGDPPPPPEEKYDWYEFRESPNGGYKKQWRIGRLRFSERLSVQLDEDDPDFRRETRSTQQQSAVIQWHSILEKTEVVEDYNDHSAPWDNCDGWAHEFHFDAQTDWDYSASYTDMRGHVYATNHTDAGVIVVDPKAAYLPTWKYFHDAGASKQVARELAAQALRNCIDQLKEWYQDGWLWHGVRCEYGDAEASVWGIDCRDYAEREVVPEIAGEVAHQLEQEGWLIEGQPEPSGLKYGWSREVWRRHYRDNTNKFNVEGR